MKTDNYTLDPTTPIDRTIDFSRYRRSENLLVQIFCGHGHEMLLSTARAIRKALPHAVTIGTTTDGEVEGAKIYTRHTVAAFTTFDETSVRSASAEHTDDYDNGTEIARKLATGRTKALILFSDGTTCNGESLLKGIESVAPDLIVAGGMAGDNSEFMQTYVLEGERLLSRGVVGVALDSDTLQVQNNFHFNWSPIGIEHTIDSVVENRVYTIDGLSAVDFYAKYLGEEVAEALPATGIEFPLIAKRWGIHIARAVIARHPDNSLTFAGNLREGDRVRLGFGNANLIMHPSHEASRGFYHDNIETFFIYVCMARRRYMPGFVETEIQPFAEAATTAGFFTYGEFYHRDRQNLLLNQTLTVLALTEAPPVTRQISDTCKTPPPDKHDHASTIRALTRLIQQSTHDYEVQAEKLEAQKRYSQELLDSQKLFLRHAIHEINTPLSVIMNNIELYELEHGKESYLSNIEAAMKNIYGIYDDLSYLVNKDQVDYPRREIPLVDFIRSRIDFFGIVAAAANLSFDFRSSCDEIYLKINETKLQRIVDNNLTNAIKYTKEHETITITLTGDRDGCLLEIGSNSLLIHDIERVFDAYYRESHHRDGLGLGLNLVKQICDEEGIGIEVHTSETRTAFRYHFPGALR